jgi:dsRNA-specific ribonuclease
MGLHQWYIISKHAEEKNIRTNFKKLGCLFEAFIGALFLDFNVSGISTRGVSYFDSTGKLVSTNSPETGYASDSNYILTTNGSNVPVWTDTLDGGTF